MTSDDKLEVNLSAVIDEAWRFDRNYPWRGLVGVPAIPAHSHWIKPVSDHQHSIKELATIGLDIPQPLISSNKENNMSDRKLRTPESPVETKDLTVAIRALGQHDLDYLLDAVALVQALESNQRLVRASKLKQQDVGTHLQVVDGQGGVLTDLRDFDTFGRDNRGFVKAVVGGKMLDLRDGDFVVLTALAN